MVQDYRATYPFPKPNAFDGLGIAVPEGPTPEDLDLMRQIGAKYVRCDIPWRFVEKQTGVFDFEAYDSIVDETAKRGQRVVFILDYGHPSYTGGPMRGPATPEQRDAFVNYAKAVIGRYQGKGVLWEIYNEPNLTQFWAPKANIDEYAALAIQVATMVRNLYPQEWLISGGLSTFDWPSFENWHPAACSTLWMRSAYTLIATKNRKPCVRIGLICAL